MQEDAVVTRKRKIPIILSEDEREEEQEEFHRILALNTVAEIPSESQESKTPPLSQSIFSSSSYESPSTPLSKSLIPNERKFSQEESIQYVNNADYDDSKSIDFGDTSDDDNIKNEDNSNISVSISNVNTLIKTKRSVD